MDQSHDQLQALQRRRGKGIDLHIIIGNPDGMDLGPDEDDLEEGDEGDLDGLDPNAKTEELGLAPDILDAEGPENDQPDYARPTVDGSKDAIDEELGDTDNAADDEGVPDTKGGDGGMGMPKMDMLEMLGKGRPNGLRARAAAAFSKQK